MDVQTIALEQNVVHDELTSDDKSGGGEEAGQHGEPVQKHRRALHFWAPFNSWWRDEHDRLNRRPTTAEIEAWYRASAQETWAEGGDIPTLDETRVHAKCLRTVAAVRDYFATYRSKKSQAKGGVINTHKRRATGSSEFEFGPEGIVGLDFQLGSMLQMGPGESNLSVLPDGFDLDLMMGSVRSSTVPPEFNLIPQPPQPNLIKSQIQHTAALSQQSTLDAISHQLAVLKNAKPRIMVQDSAMEVTKPQEGTRSKLSTMSREELEERCLYLEMLLEKKETESLELEEALVKATNTSTGDLREAVYALKEMSAFR